MENQVEERAEGVRACLCASGHGCLLDVMPVVPATEGIEMVATAESMLEEVQVEARYCNNREDTLLCLAKRDALSELLGRLKHGRRNGRWARARPSISIGLGLMLPFVALRLFRLASSVGPELLHTL